MDLIVDNKSYLVNSASCVINYYDSAYVIQLYINLNATDNEEFIELADALRTHIIIIPADQSASGMQEIMINTDDATAVPMYLLKTNGEHITFDNYIPESINQSFSDYGQDIVIALRREYINPSRALNDTDSLEYFEDSISGGENN